MCELCSLPDPLAQHMHNHPWMYDSTWVPGCTPRGVPGCTPRGVVHIVSSGAVAGSALVHADTTSPNSIAQASTASSSAQRSVCVRGREGGHDATYTISVGVESPSQGPKDPDVHEKGVPFHT